MSDEPRELFRREAVEVARGRAPGDLPRLAWPRRRRLVAAVGAGAVLLAAAGSVPVRSKATTTALIEPAAAAFQAVLASGLSREVRPGDRVVLDGASGRRVGVVVAVRGTFVRGRILGGGAGRRPALGTVTLSLPPRPIAVLVFHALAGGQP